MLARLTLPTRAVALFPLAALALHEGFYRLGLAHPGADPGHGYLSLAQPLAGLLGALVVAGLAIRLAAARRLGVAGEPGVSWPRLWVVSSLGLLAVFAGQETLEALAGGHHVALLAPAGWLAPPLAGAAGGLLTLLLVGARAAVVAVARLGARRRVVARPASPSRRRLPRAARPRPGPLALSAAGRAPPLPVAVPRSL
jgi:hypothetical protein